MVDELPERFPGSLKRGGKKALATSQHDETAIGVGDINRSCGELEQSGSRHGESDYLAVGLTPVESRL
jgi:hypothetical protein